MKNLFLTGASGFLGSAVLDGLDPDSFGTITLLCRSRLSLPARLENAPNVQCIQASIGDSEKYASALGPDTCIVHLAAVTGKAAPDEYYRVNTEGTRKLLDAAKAAGARGFLFVSSIAVSFKDRKGYLYADSKQQAEDLVRQSGLRYCILRPTIILGRASPIWDSFRKLASASMIVLPGNGKVRIQPIHVADMAELLFDVVGRDAFNNEILEIGGPEALTMDEFVSRIHLAIKHRQPHILHLPLGLLVASLRVFERVFPNLLPVNSGQFSSFHNEGTAADNSLMNDHRKNMQDVTAMLASLTGEAADG